jgi:hypothetical protein
LQTANPGSISRVAEQRKLIDSLKGCFAEALELAETLGSQFAVRT